MKSMTWVEFLKEQEKNLHGAVCTVCGKLLDDNDVELLSGLCAACITKEMEKEQEKQHCEWCNREIKEGQQAVNCGNQEIGVQSYHESCYEKAADKLGQ